MASPYFNDDTIAAILTSANAVSALGVIRISGPRAWEAASGLMRKHSSGEAFSAEKVESHRLYRCVLRGQTGTLDDGMFVWMKSPRSFTGEDVVEWHLHGSPLILRRLMQELLRLGVREALPGEFSFRAFRNGKLSLDQAESVADLISSRSEESAKRALGQLLGLSQPKIASLQRELVDRLAEIEIDIDFSDQGLSVLPHADWGVKLQAWRDRVERVRREFLESQPLRDGIRLALVGEPNSGKSSLFNRLLGEDRSIVSQEAGTTRDVIREAILLKGLLFRLSDTAGIRATGNAIESEGIGRSFGEVSSAHLVLWIFDGSREDFPAVALEEQWGRLKSHLADGAKVAVIWNKADTQPDPGREWRSFFNEREIPWVALSALKGTGVAALIDLVTAIFSQTTDSTPDFLISRTRHYEVLGRASEAVGEAIQKVKAGELFPDLLAGDLRAALSHLGEITGEFSSDDLLNHIFAEFCIGK